MFKATSENQNYVNRVASHATKESRRGIIKAIPSWAAEPEEYYNSLRDQYLLASEQLNKYREQLGECRDRLQYTLPKKEYEHWSTLQTALRSKIQPLEARCSELRTMTREAGEKSWATVFFFCAKQLLDQEKYMQIIDEAKAIIGRPIVEISKGYGEKTPSERDQLRKTVSRKEKRQRFRRAQVKSLKAPGLVWSDERGGSLKR